MVNEEEIAILQEHDPEENSITWYQVDKKQTYYLLSYEEKDDLYLGLAEKFIS